MDKENLPSNATGTEPVPDDAIAEGQPDSSSTSPAKEMDTDKALAKQVFRSHMNLQRLKQLESLEQKLAAFASFSRRKDEEKGPARRGVSTKKLPASSPNERPPKLGPKLPLILEDVANNNAPPSPPPMQFKQYDTSPPFITGEMRDYQVQGLNWLISLQESGLNGILADEMGLGKTVQSISMIGYMMMIRKYRGPYLVIVPLSTVDNWLNEFATFLPAAKVLRGHATGSEKRSVLDEIATVGKRRRWDVVITSYEFFWKHVTVFRQQNFHYAIIDEGHRAKNEHTQFPKALVRCTISSMVLLTGTPIHNNLHELWALLNLLMPAFFDSAENFDDWFKVENCIDPRHEQSIRLKNLLKPLMLRRTKDEVSAPIPPKRRIMIVIPPTEQVLLWSHKVVKHEVMVIRDNGTLVQKRLASVFPYLRQVTLHPFLIPGAEPTDTDLVTQEIVSYSPKMIVLDALLAKLFERGSRVLIFSQFVTMLRILADYLDWRGYNYCMLEGRSDFAERKEQIDDFNRPNSDRFVFLLSTRAGGLGINLFTADTVIFYDMDYNPQMDYQAEDRAHRIGQKHKVHIIRMIVRGTIDESLHAITEQKKQLDEAIIRQKLTVKRKMEAVEYHNKNLSNAGMLDEAAVDGQVTALIDAMGPLEQWSKTDKKEMTAVQQEDYTLHLPSIPCSAAVAHLQYTTHSVKRKREEDLVLTTKRSRITVNRFH